MSSLSQDELKERVSNLCTVVQSTSSSHLVKLDEFASHLKSSPSSQPLIELFSLLAEVSTHCTNRIIRIFM